MTTTHARIPRYDVQPGDVLHLYGARLRVLAREMDDQGDYDRVVHEVEPCTEADARKTYPGSWRIALRTDLARAQLSTVERAPADGEDLARDYTWTARTWRAAGSWRVRYESDQAPWFEADELDLPAGATPAEVEAAARAGAEQRGFFLSAIAAL